MTQAQFLGSNRKLRSSENFSKFGKRFLATTAMTALGFMALTPTNANAQAVGTTTTLPEVQKVTHGSADFDYTSEVNVLNITQNEARTVANYVQFNIGRDAGVRMHQNQGDVFVHIDKSDQTSIINGFFEGNGTNWVLNKNGVLIGQDAKIDMQGFGASTGSINKSRFVDTGKVTLKNFGDGEIINKGTITVAEGGLAAFVSPNIRNSGVINAKMGTVVMAAGEKVTLDMYGDGLVEVTVDGELSDALIKNSGEIRANGGNVVVSARAAKSAVDNIINMDGIVNVSSAKVRGGKIVLDGGSKGRVRVAGTVRANGTKTQDAGSVDIKGQNIYLTEDARVRANSVEAAAGTIDVIASERVKIDGRITALGLAETGDVETSAPTTSFGAKASILATREWLLDPTDIIINDPLASLIEGQLAQGDMTVQTPEGGTEEGNVSVRSVIDWDTASTFKIISHNDTSLSPAGGGINATGAGNFVVESGDDFRMNVGNSGIFTNGGNVTITTADEVTIYDGIINANGGNIEINNAQSFEATAESLVTSGTGTITLNQNQDTNGFTNIATPLIQNAIDAISNSGSGKNTINVGAGNYNESVSADVANLDLKGANAGLRGNDDARGAETNIIPNSPGFHVTADNVSVDGFRIVGGDNGVLVDGANNAIVQNNIIRNSTANAVHVTNDSDDALITGNAINNASTGIRVTGGSNLADITYNVIRNTANNGIIAGSQTELISFNNVFDSGRNGISVIGSDNILIDNNRVSNAGDDGISVSGDSDDAVISNNKIVNTQNGIRVTGGSNNADIVLNAVRDSAKHGILAGSHTELISENRIFDSAFNGIKVINGDEVTISKNEIERSGADGINVTDTKAAWISYNTITNTGGHGIHVSNGDYVSIYNNYVLLAGFMPAVPFGNALVNEGADGIHVRNVTANNFPGKMKVETQLLSFDQALPEQGEEVGYDYEPNTNYAVIIRENDVRQTADDGIEVIGGEGNDFVDIDRDIEVEAEAEFEIRSGLSAKPKEFYGLTTRVLIAENTIRDSGTYSQSPRSENIKEIYGKAPNDGNGADGIHVRGIGQNNIIWQLGQTAYTGAGMSGEQEGSGFYGYAVDIIGNDVRRSGDDNIEVVDSESTLIFDNKTRKAGFGGGINYGGADRFGADGIHTRNIGFSRNINPWDIWNVMRLQGGAGLGGVESGLDFVPYAVVISENDTRITGDDGAEVVNAGRTLISKNKFAHIGYGDSDGDGISYGLGDRFGADAVHVRNEQMQGYGDGFNGDGCGWNGDGFGDGVAVASEQSAGLSGFDGPVSELFDVEISNNRIWNVADDGAEVVNGGRTLVKNNRITDVGLDGNYFFEPYGSDGIHVRGSGDVSIGWPVQGADRILVGGMEGYPYSTSRQNDVEIRGNRITNSGDDGVEVLGQNRVLVRNNTIDESGDDGINVARDGFSGMFYGTTAQVMPSITLVSRESRRVPSRARIINNVVTNSGTELPVEGDSSEPTTSQEIHFGQFGGDGIEVNDYERIIVKGNEVSGSVENGLFVSGPRNEEVEVSDNIFTGNTTGAHFQSGEIDLTNEGNSFIGGEVGMKFSPVLAGFEFVETETPEEELSQSLQLQPVFSSLSLVDDDGPLGFTGTIGAQTFSGQSQFFVELEDGALFEPGQPGVYNALNSTYVGTPFGTFTPSVDFANGFTLDQAAFMESRFQHFNDDPTLGLFLFPLLQGIDQEDVFNFFDPFTSGISNLNITILGLPGIPGNPVALNSIEPFAGGEEAEDTSPEALNQIETAAGAGEESNCWGDAVQKASAGQASSVSIGGSAEDLLNSEAGCGS